MAASRSLSSTRTDQTFSGPVSIPAVIPNQSAITLVNQPSRAYRSELAADEVIWRDRYPVLLSRGLELRSRYRPGWIPSWLGTNVDPATCEDSIEKRIEMVLDAKRLEDNDVVCVKRISPKQMARFEVTRTDEVNIGKYLSTEEMLGDATNHCVPILDSFWDPALPDVEYIVMPALRPYNDPEFCFIGEVVDFVTQLLEGMNFMHNHLVAHGDLTSQNIMMDGRPILPQGWHFVKRRLAPNGLDAITPRARIDHPVRYYIIDYDCSMRFSSGQSYLVKGFGGRDSDPPELMKPHYHDAFKVYDGLEFLKDQIDVMKTPDFRRRPTAELTLRHWMETKSQLDISMARWRLRRRDEFMGLRVMRDAVSAVQQSVTRILNPQVRTWSNP